MLLGRDWELEQWVINTYLVDQGINAICVSSIEIQYVYNIIIQIFYLSFIFSLNLYVLESLST